MQRISRDQTQKFAFDWRDEPLLHVQPNESFEIETWDAGSGFFKTAADKAIPENRPGFDQHPPLANPIGGPVFVEGAKKGDVLIAEIEDILVGDRSWVAVGPDRGPLGQATDWPGISQQYTTMVFEHSPGPSGTMRDGALRFNDSISWPLSPFIGTLGVAPEREVATSIDGQGAWGGNLDIRDVATGSQIHLPVFHTGGLFYLGDVHASQGDTEYCGTAAETSATVRLRFQLVKHCHLPFMRIEKEKSIIAVQAARPLETAVHAATQQLMSWLVGEYSFTEAEAYCLVSTCPDFRINIYQMLTTTAMDYVAGAELPRNLLG